MGVLTRTMSPFETARGSGAQGEIDGIGDAGGFVDDQHGYGGESANGGIDGGEADDAGAVRKKKR